MNITLVVLLVYIVVVFGVAWFFSRNESVKAYFLNKRKTSLWLLTLSTTATIVGAGATVAIVAEVYRSGISYGLALPLSLAAGVFIFGIVAKKIKEIGDKYDAYTIVDFFYKRFDKKNKMLTTVLQIFLLVIWTGIQAIAIASLASVLVGVNYSLALGIAAIVTIAYTAIGGLKVDIITDFIQFWIIFVMFFVASVIVYFKVGGFSNMFALLPKGHLDPFAFGGVGWFIGAVLLSGFIYLANSQHWQRIFSAESQSTARKSFFISIPLVIFLGILTLFLGLASSVLLSGINPESAIFSLMDLVLPPVLTGLGFAAVLAVVMSSVDSLLVGGSTIVYRQFFGRAKNEKRNLWYARGITALFGIIGFLLAFMVPNIVTLSLLVTYLALLFVPAILAGLYSKKTSSDASFFSILIPSILVLVLFPFVKANTFLVTTPLSVLVIVFYDKVFVRK